MDIQWMFLMVIAAPIADAVINWHLWLTGLNTRKANTAIGLVTLCLFVGTWLYVANNLASWTPGWLATGILFWIGWHRLLAGLRYHGRPADPTPDFFIDNSVIQILSCHEMPNWYTRHSNPDHETLQEVPYKHEDEQLAIVVSESSGLDPRLIAMNQSYAPGYYLVTRNGVQWDFQPIRKPNTIPTATH